MSNLKKKKRKKRKPRTIGEMTNRRNEWVINPATRVKSNDKGYNRKREKRNTQKDMIEQ